MTPAYDRAELLAQARHNLATAEAYEPVGPADRRQRDQNIAQIKAYIARLEHPSGGAA